MEDLWTMYCGKSNCSWSIGRPCGADDMVFVTNPSSCINHTLLFCSDILLLVVLLFNMFYKKSSKSTHMAARFRGISSLQLISAIFNGSLGLLYFCLGTWLLEEKLRKTKTLVPLHGWLIVLFHGLTWSLVRLTVSLRGKHFVKFSLWLLSILVSSNMDNKPPVLFCTHNPLSCSGVRYNCILGDDNSHCPLQEYVIEALSEKTVLLVIHQVDFLPSFDNILLMSDGEILCAGPYHQLLALSLEFQDLVNAHKETAGSERLAEVTSSQRHETPAREIRSSTNICS